MIEERVYAYAREQVDKVINEYCTKLQNPLNTIVKYKSQNLLCVMKEWASVFQYQYDRFYDRIDVHNIQTRLHEAYTHYYQYVLSYRNFNQLKHNILFNKIISFELFFFSKYDIFSQKENIIDIEGQSDSEKLFYANPLGHFTFFRLLKEYGNTKRDDIDKEDTWKKLYDELIITTLAKTKEFFFRYNTKDVIHLDDFRNYLNEDGNERFKAIIGRIEHRE